MRTSLVVCSLPALTWANTAQFFDLIGPNGQGWLEQSDCNNTAAVTCDAYGNLLSLDLRNGWWSAAGTIPPLSLVPTLKTLILDGKSLLTGTIPNLDQNTALETLSLQGRRCEFEPHGTVGGFCTTCSANCPAGWQMDPTKTFGKLTGTIPALPASLKKLDVSYQNLSGELPAWGHCTSMGFLNLFFAGTPPTNGISGLSYDFCESCLTSPTFKCYVGEAPFLYGTTAKAFHPLYIGTGNGGGCIDRYKGALITCPAGLQCTAMPTAVPTTAAPTAAPSAAPSAPSAAPTAPTTQSAPEYIDGASANAPAALVALFATLFLTFMI